MEEAGVGLPQLSTVQALLALARGEPEDAAIGRHSLMVFLLPEMRELGVLTKAMGLGVLCLTQLPMGLLLVAVAG